MFAYPSGHAHVGHVRNYMIGDVVARMKRMRGFNVLHPFGWDAFGLPAENAAIKNGTHPETWTLENIAHMKGQLQRLGISYAWEREIATCLPDYYKWNQWMFLKMLERDLAYRKRSSVNWCPSCQTVLANEQVVDGACWRCGTTVTTRELEQWFFRITHYADELLDGMRELERLAREGPDDAAQLDRPVRGRSREIRARAVRDPVPDPGSASIRASRIPDTDDDRSLHHAHRHDLRRDLHRPRAGASARPAVRRDASADPAAFRAKVREFTSQDRSARMTGEVEKEGFDTGRTAINPFTGQPVPIWVANFVLVDYGTGAVMGVPGARRARLRVRAQVQPARSRRRARFADGGKPLERARR